MHIQILLLTIHHIHIHTHRFLDPKFAYIGNRLYHPDPSRAGQFYACQDVQRVNNNMGSKSVDASWVSQQASRYFQHHNFGDRYLRSTCFLKLARLLQLFCTVLSLQQASMQILPVAPYVDTPAQFNVKHKTEQWEFPAVKNKKGPKVDLSAFRTPSKLSLVATSNLEKLGLVRKRLLNIEQENGKDLCYCFTESILVTNKHSLILKYLFCVLFSSLSSFEKKESICYMLRNQVLILPYNASFNSQAIKLRPKGL